MALPTCILLAQEQGTPPGEIYGPPRFTQAKLPDGAVQFTDQEMGVSFTMPAGWRLEGNGLRFMDRGWRGNGPGNIATTLPLHHRHADESIWLYYCVFRHVHSLTADQVDRWYDQEIDDKISERQQQEKLKGYRVRTSSYEREEIGGRRALAWVADFRDGKIAMVEYLVWVRSDRILVEFSIRCRASELDAARKDVEPMVQSVRMP